MTKVILIEEDGTTQESEAQTVVDATTAAFAALPAVVSAPEVTVENVVVTESDDSTETLVPEAAAPVEAAPVDEAVAPAEPAA